MKWCLMTSLCAIWSLFRSLEQARLQWKHICGDIIHSGDVYRTYIIYGSYIYTIYYILYILYTLYTIYYILLISITIISKKILSINACFQLSSFLPSLSDVFGHDGMMPWKMTTVTTHPRVQNCRLHEANKVATSTWQVDFVTLIRAPQLVSQWTRISENPLIGHQFQSRIMLWIRLSITHWFL